MLNGWEVVLILAAALILFGAKKLPELAKGLGQGIREFKKATQDLTDEVMAPERPRLPKPHEASAEAPPAETAPEGSGGVPPPVA